MKDLITYLLTFLAAILTMVLYSIAFGFPVMLLWNFTLPSLIGANSITFWQAVSLNLMCGILIRGMTIIKR